MFGGAAKGIHDLVEVPLRIGLADWIPNSFLTKNDIAVNHCGNFAVARAEIKTDPTTVGVPSQRSGAASLRWHSISQHDFKWPFVNAFSHYIRVERSRFGCSKMLL